MGWGWASVVRWWGLRRGMGSVVGLGGGPLSWDGVEAPSWDGEGLCGGLGGGCREGGSVGPQGEAYRHWGHCHGAGVWPGRVTAGP